MMSVTLLYAGLLALWFLVLSFRVIKGRRAPGGPSLGDGGSAAMLRRIRAHANFAEYVPLILVLMGLLELGGLSKWALHVLGAMLLAGRLLHGYALSFVEKNVFGRVVGMVLTFTSLLLAAGLCVWFGLRS